MAAFQWLNQAVNGHYGPNISAPLSCGCREMSEYGRTDPYYYYYYRYTIVNVVQLTLVNVVQLVISHVSFHDAISISTLSLRMQS